MDEKARLLILLGLIGFFGISNAYQVDYCQMQCEDPFTGQVYPHTACVYTPDVKCEQYGYKLLKEGLKEEEKNRILNLHNELRYNLSVGLEMRGLNGPQPASKEMLPTLHWDPQLEQVAQWWANQCDYQHDHCRNIGKEKIGQNIGYATAKVKMMYQYGPMGRTLVDYEVSDISAETIVNAWWNEVKDWNPADTYKAYSGSYNAQVGHFTQMAWAKTTRIGCGAVTYSTGKMNKRKYLVCNYGPTGNFLKKRMYIPYNDAGQGIEFETWSQLLPNGASNVQTNVQETTVTVNYQLGRYTYTMTVPLPGDAVVASANADNLNNGLKAIVIKYYFKE